MDYNTLLQQKVRYHIPFLIFAIIVIIVSIYIVNRKIYDTYNCLGIYNDSVIYVNIPIDYSDTITTGEYLKINNKDYPYTILEISGLDVESNINYQTYTLQIDSEFLNNEVIKMTIYYDKEKILEKIKEFI